MPATRFELLGDLFPREIRPAERELIDSLVECSLCHSRELAQLTLEQYQTITTHPSLSRSCASCVAITEWTFAYVEGRRPRDDGELARAFPPGVPERRRSKRLTVKLPVRVRLEEIGDTENLSSSGVCFSSNLPLRVGDRVRLTVVYSPGGDAGEVPARVVWRKELEGSNRARYGVQWEEEL